MTKKTLSPRIQQLLDFLALCEQMKLILRSLTDLDGVRRESDAEHIWEICMFILFFSKDFGKGVDVLHMMKLALVHDLVEIYAGDVDVFDKKGRETKEANEREARKKIHSQLPKDIADELESLFEEYEAKKTQEAIIVNAIDKFQPVFQIYNEGGHEWKKRNVTFDKLDVIKRHHMQPNELMLALYEYILADAKERSLLSDE
jgi:putative hydrolase of HD superfamily